MHNGAIRYIVLCAMLLTYISAMIRFSNGGGLSRIPLIVEFAGHAQFSYTMEIRLLCISQTGGLMQHISKSCKIKCLD